MWAYGAIGVLAGLTGGLGNALVSANISYFQGTLGLTAEEAAWIPPPMRRPISARIWCW
jgi:hypothetical protein